MYLTPQRWLDVIEQEYLRDFIAHGGAAVKFVVTETRDAADSLIEGLTARADATGFVAAHVNAERVKVHRMDAVFGEIARQMDWDALSGVALRRFLRHVGQPESLAAGRITLPLLAEITEIDEGQLRQTLLKWLTSNIFRNFEMTRDFRIAMTQLCRGRMEPDVATTQGAESIVQWLRGEPVRMAALRPLQIYQRIARHNARQALFSLPPWLRFADARGLLVTIDISHMVDPASTTTPEVLSYTRSAVVESYELLRQLVDNADELSHCLVVVLAGTPFLQVDDLRPANRSVGRYPALWNRIRDEVRDKDLANPYGALVRIRETSAA